MTSLGFTPSYGSGGVTQEQLDNIAAGAVGFVNHGAIAGTARPTGYGSIEWVGSVEPTNAVNGDIWINTA